MWNNSLLNNSFISWNFDSCKDLRVFNSIISELGTVSIFTGGTGNTVVTVLVPSVVVKVPTSDIVRVVNVGLIF